MTEAPGQIADLADSARVEAELASAPLLAGVDGERIRFVAERCRVRRLPAGATLIAAGDESDSLFILLSGRLSVHLVAPENDPVATVRPGESVGELSLIDKSPRSAFVLAAEESRVLEVQGETYWALLRSSPVVALNLLMVLARRLRGNNETITATRLLQDEYRRKSATDGLTGLYNRRWLDEMLPRFVGRGERSRHPVSLVMFDVDHFKKCNDTYGHPAGDYVLFVIAKVLRSLLRPTDIPVRYGGEEFVIILPATTEAQAHLVAERIRMGISQLPLVLPNETVIPSVTISAGVAELMPSEAAADLIKRADDASYRSKRGGRNRTSVWSEGRHDAAG